MKSWAVYIVAALGFVIYGAVTGVDRDENGNIVGSGSVGAFDIQVGDCFNDVDTSSQEIASVPGVPCSEPHDNEAYAVFDISLESYPDTQTMYEISYGECMERFETFVGREYETSSLEITTMYPSAESWDQDDREIVCAVFDINAAQLVGSAQGRGL